MGFAASASQLSNCGRLAKRSQLSSRSLAYDTKSVSSELMACCTTAHIPSRNSLIIFINCNRAHDDLHEVHRLFGALVQFDTKVSGEVVENKIAAVERLQHQDLPLDRLSCPVCRRPKHQQTSHHDA